VTLPAAASDVRWGAGRTSDTNRIPTVRGKINSVRTVCVSGT
jgi:hypothetical protein